MLQIDQSVGDGSYQGEIDATGFGSVEGRIDVSERSRVLATRSAASRTPACQATFDAIAWSVRNFHDPDRHLAAPRADIRRAAQTLSRNSSFWRPKPLNGHPRWRSRLLIIKPRQPWRLAQHGLPHGSLVRPPMAASLLVYQWLPALFASISSTLVLCPPRLRSALHYPLICPLWDTQ
jgi:hypothetical protein